MKRKALSANLIISAKPQLLYIHLYSPQQYSVYEIVTFTGLNGVPSTLITPIRLHWHCLTAFGCCGGKRLPAVIKARIEGSPLYMYCWNLATSSRTYQKRRKKYKEDCTD